MADEEKVGPNEILKAAGADRPVSEGTFLQRTGLLLASGVGGLAAAVILALLTKWISNVPSVPVIPQGSDAATAKLILDNYKTMHQIALEPFTSVFDSVVVKALLPVFTSILGYIFGSQASKTNT